MEIKGILGNFLLLFQASTLNKIKHSLFFSLYLYLTLTDWDDQNDIFCSESRLRCGSRSKSRLKQFRQGVESECGSLCREINKCVSEIRSRSKMRMVVGECGCRD